MSSIADNDDGSQTRHVRLTRKPLVKYTQITLYKMVCFHLFRVWTEGHDIAAMDGWTQQEKDTLDQVIFDNFKLDRDINDGRRTWLVFSKSVQIAVDPQTGKPIENELESETTGGV